MEAKNQVVKTPRQPNKAPIPANSFTSPPPRASRRKTRRPTSAMTQALRNPAVAPRPEDRARSTPVHPSRSLSGEAERDVQRRPREKISGMIRQSKSMTEMTTRTNVRATPKTKPGPAGACTNTKPTSAAVRNSTSGYRKEMGLRHRAHFPRSARKLATGMFSYHRINAWHRGHRDRGLTMDFPRGIRWMQTFAKLPNPAPTRSP